MESLIAFYKVHYNFAALGILILLFGFFKLYYGNIRGFVIVLAVVIAYNLMLKTLVSSNPVWFDQTMKKLEQFDFVDWIWGGSAVQSSVKASEGRDQNSGH